jgi:hypothetical protein
MGTRWTLRDLTGQVFGRLTVLRRASTNHSTGNANWIVRCLCGVEKSVRSCHLLHGRTVSCGCYNLDIKKKPRTREQFLSHMFTRYRKGAAVRGIFFNLTPEQLDEIMQRECFYCGIEPKQINRTKGSAGAFPYNGVDRLANGLGYFFENCVACCGTCNIAKQDMSVHAFVTWAQRLAGSLNAAV